jgi:pilus assembly protein Flp/PilA
MRPYFKRLLKSERGASAVEYGLIISLIVIAIVATLSNVASKTNLMWTNVANEVNKH